MQGKKTNPRKRPVSEADIKRVKKEAENRAIATAEAIFLTVLLDKFGGADYITDVWKEVNSLSESITKGYVSLMDLIHVLREEYNIDIYDGSKEN